MVGVGEGDDTKPLEPEDLHEHDGIGAIASGDAEDGIDALLHNDAIYALDPGAAVDGEAHPLRDIDQPFGVRVGDEYIVQVNGLIPRGQKHLYRDCGGDADGGHGTTLPLELVKGKQ